LNNFFYLLLLFVEGSSGHKVSYAYFVAFISLLRNMELIKKVYLNATNGSRTAELTKVCLTTKTKTKIFISGIGQPYTTIIRLAYFINMISYRMAD
jgi:hypothetical protein